MFYEMAEWVWSDLKWQTVWAPLFSPCGFSTYRARFSFGWEEGLCRSLFICPARLTSGWSRCQSVFFPSPVPGEHTRLCPPFTSSSSIWEAGKALHGTLGLLPNHVRLPAPAHRLSLCSPAVLQFTGKDILLNTCCSGALRCIQNISSLLKCTRYRM